ncbi:uncharacterized protein N7498_001084 [Penicillium cinerascens]|uniref:Uncharacterized protein n=1 Tax=Penicillium cinerascens TaxID=70096 RepID=A0A9W9NFG8_9EURO|nr:uncharacterized protein N7498_001084 [Penicillium cinerascens]KAJ5218985.1 hypothetical protein N7498_001084 [Penicillium cinerascens]
MSISRYSSCPQTDFGRGPHWLHESPFLPHLWETTQDVGAPSLKHAAMKMALVDQSALKPDLFAQLPWHIAHYLWECLGRCEVGNWRTVLAISTAHATTADLVAIGNMKNLVALDIYPAKSRVPKPEDIDEGKGLGLEDRIVRSWLEIAETAGSLQQLRILRLHNQPRLTTKALWMLEKLPNLREVFISECAAFGEVIQKLNTQRKGVRLGGWIARRINLVRADHEALAQVQIIRGPLVDVYKDALDTDSRSENNDRGQTPPNLGRDIPILEFMLSFAHRGTQYDASQVIHLTRARQQIERKRSPSQGDTSRSQVKRVVRDRGGRDMADVLSDFF